MDTFQSFLKDSPLGKSCSYSGECSPALLFPIPRKEGRKVFDFTSLPFHGIDLWTSYELSWLNAKGKPQIALAEFYIPCDTTYLIESKSLKIYLNSYNQSQFQTALAVKSKLEADLSQVVEGPVAVKLFLPDSFYQQAIYPPQGRSLDELDIQIDTYQVNPFYLTVGTSVTEEKLYTHLFRSNCPVTGQPDWATVFLHYHGYKIDWAGLLQYLISFRQDEGFLHEQCVEKIYMDLMKHCQPTHLTVYARFTRRGGLDINPFRSNFQVSPDNYRLLRQ